jgi:hypothetical protein
VLRRRDRGEYTSNSPEKPRCEASLWLNLDRRLVCEEAAQAEVLRLPANFGGSKASVPRQSGQVAREAAEHRREPGEGSSVGALRTLTFHFYF